MGTLQEAGGNAVAFNPIHYVYLKPGTPILSAPPKEYGIPWFIWPDSGQGVHGWPQTISPDLVYAAVCKARQMGLTVALKPMVDVEGGGWRGNISVKGEWQSEKYDVSSNWLWGYRVRLMKRYADMLHDGDILIAGTEYLQVTRELGAGWLDDVTSYPSQPHFGPKLTYDANWGWADDAEYVRLKDAWPQFDYRAVSAYFPLVAEDVPPAPDVDTLVQGWHRRGIEQDWCPRIDDSLVTLGDGSLSKVLFGEIGYRADDRAAHDPGADPSTGNLSPQTQVNCWQAFRTKFDGPDVTDKLAGWLAWSWELYPELADPRSHALNIEGRQDAAHWALAANPF